MRCSKAQEYLSLELDGMLPPGATAKLSEHLDACGDCREYREDLQLSQRFLAATEPELPDNFDWKLQLRLNQSLKEAAGEAAYPWEEKRQDRGSWFRNFGTAAAFGAAAVLALAVFLGPGMRSGTPETAIPGQGPVLFQDNPVASLGNDRLPLDPALNFGGSGFARTVSGAPLQRTSGGRNLMLKQGWTGRDLRDWHTISNLRRENMRLNQLLRDVQHDNQLLRAKLDTSTAGTLDLGE